MRSWTRWCSLCCFLFACSDDDADFDGGIDAGDVGARFDAESDAGTDAGDMPDAAMDSGSSDAERDAGMTGSAGCGMASDLATEEWVPGTVEAGGMTREYWVWLPAGYDPSRPYPVVYQFHGCSDNRESNNVPVQNESGADAIHVRGRAIERCWDNAPDGSGVAYFDAIVPRIESTFCADPERRFATGYSSGSFMSHRLACSRGDMLRGIAVIAGGGGGGECVGNVAALMIHDRGDPQVDVMAGRMARDRLLARNGCDMESTAVDPDPCVEYSGCGENPVVWCETMGMQHMRQDGLAAPAFWNFLSSLP